MVLFDQLRISDAGDKLYINLHVNAASYYDDIYLDSLTIIPGDKITTETNLWDLTSNYIYKAKFDPLQKEAHLVLDKGSFDEAFLNWNGTKVIDSTKPHAKVSFEYSSLSGPLFFVYVTVTGQASECTPCGSDDLTTLGVTFDESLLYQQVMGYTKNVADDCHIPRDFIDFILRWNVFKAAVETEHYLPALQFYKMLFSPSLGGISNGSAYGRRCGCHG